MNTTWQYRPSKRPSVSQVQDWELLFSHSNDRMWRPDLNGHIEVYNGYPFPDFYKVIFYPQDRHKKKISKLFYGETAHHDVCRYVSDLGADGIYEVIL